MRKYLTIISMIFIMMMSSSCVTSIQRIFDEDLNIEQTKIEMNAMFPAIPDLYAWLSGNFIQSTLSATQALPSESQFGYKIRQPETHTSANCAYVRAQLDYWGFFRKREYYKEHFKAQDDAVLEFCRQQAYTVKKYKPGFSKRMFNQFGLADLTYFNPVNIKYGYSYVISQNDGEAIMIYSPVIYGNFSKTFGEVDQYYWDALFIAEKKSKGFIDSLPNSFLADMIME
ncbi:hypothetical protein LJC48_04710 [Desulfovibrio sp. OttesenSCG-928-C06]|nr:hypothetical protein [Desulfovibrio sp. OttesenSCG-928-C06]